MILSLIRVRNGVLLGACLVVHALGSSSAAVDFPGPAPAEAFGQLQNGQLTLGNRALRVTWDLRADALRLAEIVGLSAKPVRPAASPLFVLEMRDGRKLTPADATVIGEVALDRVEPDPRAVRQRDRFGGWQATVRLLADAGRLKLAWRASLRDEANYATLELVLDGAETIAAVRRATLLDLPLEGVAVSGTVSGSPLVSDEFFLACEDPQADNTATQGRAACAVDCLSVPSQAERWRATAVIGVAPAGQMRRAFLYYVERERARPYAPFVHYNSWWDIAWGDRKMTEAECLDVLASFNRELASSRGVPLDSFCFDDGWDDNRTLWQFHSGFPAGFAPLQTAATAQGAALGVWLSPWGGYGQAKEERLRFGRSQGFETNANGFSLAGPRYYERFRGVCLEMTQRYGCNYFKFDGIAQGVSSAGAGPTYAADVAALLQLIDDLRVSRPDLFVNVTTGTWPSPYWLWHGDSIWRNGDDVGFYGAGSLRQQSITYRDMHTYRMIVRRAPLYPLNSLMICSVVYASRGTAQGMNDDVQDLADEVRMACGGGTQCLELYMTPGRMRAAGWDALAEAIRWMRAQRGILADTHWVGGDPGAGEVYGYASWSARQGVLVLRNPRDGESTLRLRLREALQLPPGAPEDWVLQSPWQSDAGEPPREISAQDEHAFVLGPLQTRVFEVRARP